MVVKSEILYDFPIFFDILIAELAAGGVVNFTFKVKRDVIVENPDLEPKIDAKTWKELSKEMGSKILPSGDGSYRKTFKQIASLITMGKLK
ncbi:hypothetical protein Tco_0761614 [Tanacetum coccineum]